MTRWLLVPCGEPDCKAIHGVRPVARPRLDNSTDVLGGVARGGFRAETGRLDGASKGLAADASPPGVAATGQRRASTPAIPWPAPGDRSQ